MMNRREVGFIVSFIEAVRRWPFVRVLLVEDDLSLGEVVQRGLIEEGHAVDLERTLSGARRARRDQRLPSRRARPRPARRRRPGVVP